MKDLTDLCDYMVINLTFDAMSSGVSQYYKNPRALEKLLTQAVKSRNEELGKLAALEYEKITEKDSLDYSRSVKRVY